MSPIRVGFLGCGVIAHAHAYSLKGLQAAGICDIEFGPMFDHSQRRRDRFAERLGGQAAGDAEQVAANSDVVYICTATAAHLEGIEAASRHNRPAFCEKPLARNLAETRQLAAAATTLVQVGLVLRTAPVFVELARIAHTQEFGRLMACTWRDDQFFPIQGHYASKWRADVTIAGSGVLLEHTIHDIDIIGVCLGAIGAVAANSDNHFGHPGIEDAVSALLTTRQGASISLVTVWHDVVSRGSSRRVEVMFEKAIVTLDDDFSGPLTIQTSDGTQARQTPPPAWVDEVPLPEGGAALAIRPYIQENRDFIDAIDGGRAPSPSLEEALTAHEVVEACYRSAAGGGARETC